MGGALFGYGCFCLARKSVEFPSWPGYCGQKSVQSSLYPLPMRSSDMVSVFSLAQQTVPIRLPPASPVFGE